MSLRLGRYETLRTIASGGMAMVHLGRALGAGGFERFVAIKVMHPHLATDPDFVAMFLDEARLAARVRHPNVVATIDVQEDPLFLVMDYIEGPSLFEIMRQMFKAKSRVPMGVTLRIFIDTLAGLHAAHDLVGADGAPLLLVHRDVSPQNVLVGTDGITRITDFGVARAESRLSTTRGGQLKGKIAYMAPEQILSEPVDRRSDLYAAGVVLWEMLTGQRLFRGDNDGALVAQVLAGVKKSPRDVYPAVPEPIDKACMRALQNQLTDRYPTAGEFADSLEDAAREAAITIASPRVVAAFIKELAVHKGLDDLPPAPPSHPGAGSSPRSVGGANSAQNIAAGTDSSPRSTPIKAQAAPPAGPLDSLASSKETVRPGAPRPRSEDETLAAPVPEASSPSSAAGMDGATSSPGSTNVGAVVSMGQRPRTILGGRGLLITALLAIAGAGAFFVLALRSNVSSTLHNSAGPETTSRAPPALPTDPPAPPPASISSAAAPSPSSAGDAGLPPGSSTSGPAGAPGGTIKVKANPPTGAKGPAGKPSTPPGTKTAPSPTSFRPPDL